MNCPYCNSKKMVKAGFQYGAGKKRQRYVCMNCHRHTVKPKGV